MKACEEKKQPKVLAFFSCYNHEKYVAEAIESVLNQTYRNIELFIVNDGSTDNSAKIIESYRKDERVKFVNLSVNTAAAGAFRIIDEYIRASDAEYIAGMASDDKWKLNKLEKQIAFMEKNTSYKACFTWDELIFEEGADTRTLKEGYSHWPPRDRFKSLEQLIMEGNFYNGVSVVMRRNAYVENGGYNWAYRNLQDYDYWVRFHMHYPVYIIEEKLTYYRKHATNLSTTPVTFMRDRNETFAICMKYMEEIDDKIFKKIFFKDFAYYDSCTHLEILAEKIAMLMRHNSQVHKQVAFCLYMDNGRNNALTELLKEKYELDTYMFHKLTGSYGMEYLLVDYTPDVAYEYSELNVLLDFIDNVKRNERDMYAVKYDALRQLLHMDWKLNKNINTFLKIRDVVWKYRDMLIDDTKKMLIIAEEYVEKYQDMGMPTDTFDYIAVLPRKDRMFIDGLFTEPTIETEKERVYLYDGQEHRIQYLWEIQKDDVGEIVLWGCCNEEYPIMDIMENVTLATKLEYYPAENDNVSKWNVQYLVRKI